MLKEGNMLTKLKSALLILVCSAVVIQLGGCMYDRDRRPDHDRQRQHDHGQGPAELDIHVH